MTTEELVAEYLANGGKINRIEHQRVERMANPVRCKGAVFAKWTASRALGSGGTLS